MHREIGVALARAQLRIGELAVFHPARVLFAERQRAQRLGEERESRDAQRDLAGARLHQPAFDAHVVAQIEQLQHRIELGSELVALEVELDLAALILQMRERRFAVRPQRDEPSRERIPRRIVVALERGERLLRRRGTLESVRERRDAALQQLFQLLTPRRFDEPGGHAALLPKRFRNASMNGSRSPSITLWTSLTFSSVRWSFTIV